jgi:hypothetical protein
MQILRANEDDVLLIAWTGKTATLLNKGKTVHSQFLLPLNLNENSVSNLKENNKKSEVIQKSK